jgi:O-antigen ligase
MKTMSDQKQIKNMVLWGAAVTSLLITPFSFDPLNVSKFALLSVIGFSILGALSTTKGLFRDPQYRLVTTLAGAFVAVGLITLIATRTNLFQQMFGVAGRHTGFLTYLSLIAFMLGATFVSSTAFMARIMSFLFITGLISLSYGLIQAFNLDPLNWTNSFSPVIGFLGNPNFQSSFMAITATAAFSLIFKSSIQLWRRTTYVIYILLALFSIHKSNSQQGYLVFGVGILVVLLFWIRAKFQSKSLLSIYLFISTGIGVAVVLDILQKAPWASILYKESVSNRGDFWRSGWRMTLDHPLIGVGFDNYGDWYRRYRDLDAISARGVDTMSNAAHNVFLDISTAGGFPLLIIYLAILGLTARAAFKLLLRTKNFDASLAGIVGAWFAYVAQSLISINQIGLAVWGWVFSGAIIGYEIYTRTEKQVTKRVTVDNLGSILIGGFCGLIIGLPPLVSDLVYRNAIDSREIVRVESAAYQWPQNGDRMIQIAATFRENELFDQAIKVARDATKFAPERYEAWLVLSSLPNLPEAERIQAIAKMKELDPFNPNLK